MRELLQKEAYEFGTFPDVDNVVHATFPYKGSVSIPIAIRKVYPLLNDFIKVLVYLFTKHSQLGFLTHPHSEDYFDCFVRLFTSPPLYLSNRKALYYRFCMRDLEFAFKFLQSNAHSLSALVSLAAPTIFANAMAIDADRLH